MRRCLSALSGVVLAATLACGAPPRCVDDDGNGYDKGRYTSPIAIQQRMDGPTFVEILEVQTRGDRLFYCTGVQGLNVFNISDPVIPRVVATGLTGSAGSASYPRCQHLALTDDYIFVSNRGDEIQPTPFITAFDNTGNTPRPLFTHTDDALTFETLDARGDRLAAAVHGDGVVLYDVGPTGLTLRAHLAEGFQNAWAIRFLDADTLVVGDGPGGLKVVDIRNPDTPVIRASVPFDGAATGSAQSIALDTRRRIAFVAAGAAGLVAVSLADLDAPTVLDVLGTPGNALEVALDAQDGAITAYLADWNDARAIDVRDASNMQLHATSRPTEMEVFSRVLGIGARGTEMYIGEWHGMFQAYYNRTISAPDLYTRARAVEFNGLSAGEAGAVALIIENKGAEPLTLFDVQIGARQEDVTGFSVDKTTAVLEPGERDVIEVRYDAPDEDQRISRLFLCTDDPDEPARAVRLIANEADIAVGDTIEPVEVDLIGGGTWRSDEQDGPVLLAYFATF